MGIDVRQKGAEGERQVIKMLTPIIQQVMRDMDFPAEKVDAALKMVQRNQNQSAVGGNDLSNTFGLSIEVKRQEQIAINTWRSEEHTSELQSLMSISYAVFCLKKKKNKNNITD